MRVIVCGSRGWTDYNAVYDRLRDLAAENEGDVTVVHGGALGADTYAARAARALSLDQREYVADWNRHGKAAGPIRNRQMATDGADLVLAFWDGKSPGTLDMIRVAMKQRITVEICS